MSIEHDITAEWSCLFRQAKESGEEYFDRAEEHLIKSKLNYTVADVLKLAEIMAYEFRTTSMVIASQNIASGVSALGDKEW